MIHVTDQCLRPGKVFVPEYPEFRKTFQKRYLPQAAGELLVPYHAGNSGLLEEVPDVAHVGQGFVGDQSFHGLAAVAGCSSQGRRPVRNSPGLSPRSRISTRAEPTTTPSA